MGAIAENCDNIHTNEQLYETIGELLIGYGVCSDEAAAQSMSERIFESLLAKGVVKASAKQAQLLSAPVKMQALANDIIDPFVAEPGAIALGQQMMTNTSEGLPEEVLVKMTKTRQLRQAKEQNALSAQRSWAANDSLKAAEEALPIYLNALSMRSGGSTDVNVAEFTLMKPEKTVPLIENGALRLVTGRR